MGYSANDGMVRVDFFRPSGRWYTTEAVDMSAHYHDPTCLNAVEAAVVQHLSKHPNKDGGLRLAGMIAVCLEPHHHHAYPISFTVPGSYE